ncbi:MAG: hypothetical protein C3F02_03475 [Parcubacteria group bacterium]|nr:MAG: hypothetical protein C3F02_03475 [Parcubacteria group bacterium]
MKNKFILIIAVILSILALTLIFFVSNQKPANTVTNNNMEEKSVLVKGIQEKVRLINLEKSYQTKTLNNEKFLDHMTDGGAQLVGYFKDGKIYKIVERLGLSYGVKTYEYYFSNEQLVLVDEKEEDFPDTDNTGSLDYTKVELAFEGRYYFDGDKLIDKQITGQKRFFDNSTEPSFITLAKQNIQLLKTE